ncbi:peptide/nickel transport system ATP-binding protein [Quadrisphaera granulorum]|uniref:Peptide/nickel transport system ATP-binding protein n=1 Tax=Quadrisphaera granulorum TaxID=317664 RepID=A0A315ZYW1_9ACTN|nr:dipeptide/oligopeptide/nickel ABC transporter ATP-binding protein [Quadrisphaera granulorum]PWJ50685.1 peptide/nickel transport system ATP-binding protein [Quadrisphaera granulorum]SZE97933.1 peptide/nickel transport system ATP-binding protein [Quadrisphaera granulorum]
MTGARVSGVLLSAHGLVRRYRAPGGERTVLDGVDLDVHRGESLALLGRSGAGKSTLLRVLLALEAPDAGAVTAAVGDDERRSVRPHWRTGALRWYRRAVQHVPQDSAASLDPRLSALQAVEQPLVRLGLHRAGSVAAAERAAECLEAVGVGAALHGHRPRQLSGGQAQRVAIARALAPRPVVVLADEPVSGLDAPLREHVLDALARVRSTTALVVVSHDLAAVAALCERTAVLHAGRLVEDRPTCDLLADPRHEAVRELVDALPRLPSVDGAPQPA